MIPAYASSSLVFLMKYSAYKLNKQGDNIHGHHIGGSVLEFSPPARDTQIQFPAKAPYDGPYL